MTNTIHQTQCPHCAHTFAITDEQLNIKSGYAKCGNCKKIFSAIENLQTAATHAHPVGSVAPASSASLNQSPAPASPPQPSKPAPASAVVVDDGLLFDDHLGIDEEGGVLKSEPAKHTRANNRNAKSASSTELDFEIIEDFDTTPVAITGDFSKTTTQASTGQDEDWLNELLEEENRKNTPQMVVDNKLTTISREPNDVSSMLEDLGVGVSYETPISENEYQQKLEQRLNSQVASHKRVRATSLGMTMVWALGSVLLALALWGQYLIFNRETLIKDPEKSRPLVALCDMSPISCNLPSVDTKLIDSRVLSIAPAKTGKDKTDLVLILHNTSQQAVLYPNLKITLRDGNETKAQLALSPAEYNGVESNTLIGGQTKPIKLRVDYPKNDFSQANIDLFY